MGVAVVAVDAVDAVVAVDAAVAADAVDAAVAVDAVDAVDAAVAVDCCFCFSEMGSAGATALIRPFVVFIFFVFKVNMSSSLGVAAADALAVCVDCAE